MSTPARIAFVGTHGTGKTTLSEALLSQMRSLGISAHITPEVPRVICNAASDPTFFRRGKNSVYKQLLILLGQMHYETLIMSATVDVLICDRSILDHWAYTKYLYNEDFASEGLLDLYERLVFDYLSKYFHLFYIPIEFRVIDDGTREGDKDFQAEIDSMIHGLLIQSSLPFTVISGPLEKRLQDCLEFLKPHFQKFRGSQNVF